jgi:uncharacterized CHY-type Zn-finger protein
MQRAEFEATMGSSKSPRDRLIFLIGGFVCLLGCGDEESHSPRSLPVHENSPPVVAIEPRQAWLPTYPCSSCHEDLEQRPQRRKLVEFHTVRNRELNHGDTEYWCYQCHSAKNIDRLVVIASGKLVTFDEAYLLCGSCHGDKLRDWKAAVHGKTMGNWKGEKLRRSCTGCHNPHKPKFSPLQPEEAPIPPEDGRVFSSIKKGQR